MKRFLLSVLAILVGLGLVAISAISIGQKQLVGSAGAVDAENNTDGEESKGGEVVVLPELGKEYYLAYPGILPDNPMYRLKMLRDRLAIWVADDEEEGDLNLLYADKRIRAAYELVKGGKKELGAATALKSQQYLKRAWDLSKRQVDDEGRVRLRRACEKHEEVLGEIEIELGGVGVDEIEAARQMNHEIGEEMTGLATG